MKNFTNTIKLTFLLTILIGIAFTTKSYAQESDNVFYVSPSFETLEYTTDARTVESKVFIQNTYSEELEFILTPVLMKIVDGKFSIETEKTDLLENVTIKETSIKIAPSLTGEVIFTVAKPEEFGTNFALGISVSTKGVEEANSVGALPQIISLFYIQNKDAKTQIEVVLNTEKSSIISPEVKINGTIKNIGEKVFSPSGVLRLFKQNVQYGSFEISSQVLEPLLPGEEVKFTKSFKLDFGNAIKSTGLFSLEARIEAKPQEQILTRSVEIFNIDRNLLIVIVIVSIILLIVTVALSSTILENRKLKKSVAEKTDNLKK